MNGYKLTDEEEPQLLGGLTAGTSQQVAPVPVQPPPPTMAQPPATQAQAPAAVPPAAPATPPPQLPGMPAGMTVDSLTPYLTRQRTQTQRFGPDQVMALQESLNKRQNSFGNRLTSGLKGFADAIMMGVAQAGNPGWQQAYDQSEQQFSQDQRNALKDASDANIKQVEAGMTLDKLNPNSELSKSAQESYAPLFEKLGYPPEKLKGMSAANIDSTLQLMAAYGGKEAEMVIKQYEAEIERMRLAAAAGKNASDAELARQKQRTDAATELLKRSGNAKVLGIPIPFTSDVSGADEDAARNVLIEQMKGGTTVQAETGPLGATTIKDGVEYEWSPISKKYHKKQ